MISDHASPLAVLGGVDSGGQNVYVGQLSKHLAAMGYQVDIFTRRDNDRLPEVVEWINGVRVIHVNAGPAAYIRKEELLPLMDAFAGEIIEFARRREQPYDVVHANFFLSAKAAIEIKRRLGIPFIVTFHALGRVRRMHQGEDDDFTDERFAIEDAAIAEAAQVIAECPQDKEDLVRLYRADPAKISIVPCGFDKTEFWPVNKIFARLMLDLPPEEKIILQLGRMVRRKGVENVVRALACLERQHGITARLVVVGGESPEPDPERTPEIGRLMRIAREEGVADRVTFTGSRGREVLKNYYSAADIFVSTPWYEPFGITPVEAMACGTPVLGSNVGGVKFTVRDGETGYLVPPQNPDALAGRLAYLYNNPEVLDLFSQQAIRRANDLFTWDRVANAVASLVEEVLFAEQNDSEDKVRQLDTVDRGFDRAVDAIVHSKRLLRNNIIRAAQTILSTFETGGKVLVVGNGGSAADAQHLASELVGRFLLPERPGLPVISLTTDSSVLTAWANDVGYEDVFARQVQALGRPGDLLIGISTSGQSRNVVQAFKAARRQGLETLALLGNDGGEVLHLSDLALVVPSADTTRIQEVHTLILHLLCELVENEVQPGTATAQAALEPIMLEERPNGTGEHADEQTYKWFNERA